MFEKRLRKANLHKESVWLSGEILDYNNLRESMGEPQKTLTRYVQSSGVRY